MGQTFRNPVLLFRDGNLKKKKKILLVYYHHLGQLYQEVEHFINLNLSFRFLETLLGSNSFVRSKKQRIQQICDFFFGRYLNLIQGV